MFGGGLGSIVHQLVSIFVSTARTGENIPIMHSDRKLTNARNDDVNVVDLVIQHIWLTRKCEVWIVDLLHNCPWSFPLPGLIFTNPLVCTVFRMYCTQGLHKYNWQPYYLVTNDAILVDGLCVGLGEEGLGGGPARPALDRLGVPGPEVDRKFELLPHLRPHGFLRFETVFVQLCTYM